MNKDPCRKNRRNLERTYGRLYHFDCFGGDRLTCAYCGDIRETVDHVPPLSVVDKVGTKQLKEKGIDLVTVPCCKSCNAALNARPLATMDERLAFLYRHYQTRAEQCTLWSLEEINEPGESLRQMVKARQLAIRREILTKIRGLERTIARMTARE